MSKMQFQIREPLLGVSLIGLALGILGAHCRGNAPSLMLALSWFGIGPLIGAGLTIPFKRPFLGAILGGTLQMLVICYLLHQIWLTHRNYWSA